MNKKPLFLCGILLLSVFSLRSFGQARISRTTDLRRYQPITSRTVYGPRRVLIRTPQPMPGMYYSRNAYQNTIINVQNAVIFIRDNIREYPSNNLRERAQVSSIETPQYMSNNSASEARIQNMETRLRNLESLASQIKEKLNNIPTQNSMSDGYNQRLVSLEEQMQALRDVLVELRNYLASKK